MAKVCQTCGDRGFEEAIVYCDSCNIEVIHRYCVGITPVPITDCIVWICEECDESDSDSDQTVKLQHKESETKKMKKKKKKKKKSNHMSPVLDVEDHDESVEVSSSLPVKEAVEESKSLESSDSGKSHGVSASEAEKSTSVQDHSSCTSKRNDCGSDGKVDENALRVSAVEDHGLQDANNVEPVKETKESILETGSLSSGEDYNTCTSNLSDSGSDGIEVHHTDKVTDMSKKNEKEGKKKKKKKTNEEKKSSNRTQPVLAVEDHGIQDATDVEPEKVSSSPVKEAMNESKRNVASVLEAEKSSTVPDHSSCTSKRNDSGSDRKEVDQTANLKNILKRSEKKKKTKKNKTSSNRSPPVISVEDHGVQGATTNVEPVEVSSSSSLEETMESKRPHELTGLVGDKASVSEAEHSSSVQDHNSCITQKRNQSSGNIPLTSENRQIAQMSAGLLPNHYRAQPIKKPIWRGLMSVKGRNIDGIGAHVSSLACSKVHETATALPACLSAEMLPRWEVWPNSFLKNGGPKDESIALFFFPSNESNDKKVFHSLVLDMKNKDIAMRCLLDDAVLLLFTSYMLPKDSWTFNEKDYLWGVFKPRKTSGR